jgi:hypothetical protein
VDAKGVVEYGLGFGKGDAVLLKIACGFGWVEVEVQAEMAHALVL